jgi:hypothetical protein
MVNVNWGSVADWVSGIGSLTASVVALYVALDSKRIKLRGYAGTRLIVGQGRPSREILAVSATNVSQRPTVISNISFTFSVWRWRRQGIVTFFESVDTHGIPKTLVDGETGSWHVPLNGESVWLSELARKFPVTRFDVWTWRFLVHTSNGGTTTFRAEKRLRTMFLEELSKQKSAATSPPN